MLEDLKQTSLEVYYGQFSKEQLQGIQAIAKDMWDPYLAAIKAHATVAEEKIVSERFHVTRYETDAVDTERRQENKLLTAKGEECLKGSKHLWLMNEEHIAEWPKGEFDEIRKMKLKTAKAWAIKKSLQRFWGYRSPENAENYFQLWFF